MNHRPLGYAFLLFASLAATTTRADVTYLITVDSASVTGGTQGYLDFQFNAGDTSADSATATISNFSSSNLALGSLDLSGATTGSSLVPGPIVLGNSLALNEIFQSVTFGSMSSFSFDVTLGGQAIDSPSGLATAGTTFSLGVYDSNFNDLLPSSLDDSVLTLDIAPITGGITPTNFAGSALTAAIDNGGGGGAILGPGGSGDTGEPPGGSVPEPGSIVLVGVGLAILVGAQRFGMVARAQRGWRCQNRNDEAATGR